MPLLAFDCAGDTTSVALGLRDDHKLLTGPPAQRPARDLIQMVQQLLNENHLQPADLTGLFWSVGPGSFTGVRIATSVAQGLGYGLGIPLYPVSSLELAARCLEKRLKPGQRLLVADDARMGEVYWASFCAGETGLTRLHEDALDVPEALELQQVDLASGSAKPLLQAANGSLQWLEPVTERAGFLLPLNMQYLQDEKAVTALQAEPVYLRNQSAWKRLEEQ